MGGRSGPIQAALNLEIPEGNIKYFNVKMEGLNGQLPNLDLVNLVVRLCKKQNIDVGIHHRVSNSLLLLISVFVYLSRFSNGQTVVINEVFQWKTLVIKMINIGRQVVEVEGGWVGFNNLFPERKSATF